MTRSIARVMYLVFYRTRKYPNPLNGEQLKEVLSKLGKRKELIQYIIKYTHKLFTSCYFYPIA